MIFIERIIYKILKNAVDYYITKPELFEQFLIDGGLDVDEAANQKDFFISHQPNVIHGYARQGDNFPIWAITLGGESNDQDYLGEDASCIDEDEETYLDENGNPIDMHIRRWSHSFQVWTITDHPDVTLYYYYFCKKILQESKSLFQDEGIDEITFSGAELVPDPKYLPDSIFVRQLIINLKSDDIYHETVRPGVDRGKTIAGIHVPEEPIDESVEIGDPPISSEVHTNIRIYNE